MQQQQQTEDLSSELRRTFIIQHENEGRNRY